jgi:uncharacterized protein YfaP (DUF2135 family)
LNKLLTILVLIILIIPALAGCQQQLAETTDRSIYLAITSPLEDSETRWGFTTVRGTVSPANAVVSVDSVHAKVEADGSFESDYIVLNEGKNDIRVTATSGSEEITRTVTVNYDLELHVSISVNYKPGKDWFTESPARIDGRVSDLRAEVSINGQKAAVDNDGYILAMIELVEGTNTLTAIARLEEQTAIDTWEAIYVPPPLLAVAIFTPDDGFESKLDIVKITGTVSDPEAHVVISNTIISGGDSPVILDSVPARVTSGGSFYAYITLEKGDNRIEAAALRDGEPASDTINISYEPPPTDSATQPELRIASPQNNEEYRINVLTVMGTVNDPGAMVLVNGVEAVVASDGSFQGYAVLTKVGENNIDVIALGDESKAVQTIIVTFTPPLVVYLNASPEPGIDYTKEPLSVTGIVNKPEASVTVNGKDVPVDENGLFEAQVLLREGSNQIKAIAELGNENDETYILYLVENGVLNHVPGYSIFFDARFEYGPEVKLKAGQTLRLLVTLETRKDGPGDFSGSFVYVGEEYGLLPLPWPEGVDAYLEPPEFTAYPNITYNFGLVISTTPEPDAGTYYLHFYHIFETSSYGSGWIKLTVE